MVVDGQGGGIGATIIKRLRGGIGHELKVLALGTNSIATSMMLKAGANKGATGENAILNWDTDFHRYTQINIFQYD